MRRNVPSLLRKFGRWRPTARNVAAGQAGAGHFAWEQASDEYGRLIVEWVTGGFQRLAGAVTA